MIAGKAKTRENFSSSRKTNLSLICDRQGRPGGGSFADLHEVISCIGACDRDPFAVRRPAKGPNIVIVKARNSARRPAVQRTASRPYHMADPNTAWAYVRHPDASTWTIESGTQVPCGSPGDSLAHVARVLDRKTQGRPVPDIVYGRWFVPIRLVLTRQ